MKWIDGLAMSCRPMLTRKRAERPSDLAHRDQLFGFEWARDCLRLRASFHRMRTPPTIVGRSGPTYPRRNKPRGDAFWLIHCSIQYLDCDSWHMAKRRAVVIAT